MSQFLLLEITSQRSLKFKFIWGRGVSRFPDSPYEGGPPTFTLLSSDQTSITFSDKNPVSSPARISNIMKTITRIF